MNISVNKPYPEPRVEGQNEEYANILLQDYAGINSESTAIYQYSYQYIDKYDENENLAETIEKISISEMKHLSLIGKTIKLLGGNPKYATLTCNNTSQFWTAENVYYGNNIKELLINDIMGEKKAIENYKIHRDIINDKYIKELLDRIIEDEYLHIKVLNELLIKYT